MLRSFQLPTVWTNASQVTYNFTAFSLPTGETIVYTWGLGSAPGQDDVLPLMPVNTSSVVRLLSALPASSAGLISRAANGPKSGQQLAEVHHSS